MTATTLQSKNMNSQESAAAAPPPPPTPTPVYQNQKLHIPNLHPAFAHWKQGVNPAYERVKAAVDGELERLLLPSFSSSFSSSRGGDGGKVENGGGGGGDNRVLRKAKAGDLGFFASWYVYFFYLHIIVFFFFFHPSVAQVLLHTITIACIPLPCSRREVHARLRKRDPSLLYPSIIQFYFPKRNYKRYYTVQHII